MSVSGESKKKSRKPVEHPNTLQSRSVARVLDLISEGPIEGLVDQENPKKSIYMDETPIMNADGSLNFEGVEVIERYGESDQDAIPGFSQVETEQPLGQVVSKAIPTIFTVSDPNIKQIRLKVRVNGLHTQNQSNGDVLPTTVQLKVELGTTLINTASVIDELPLTSGVAAVQMTAGGTSYTARPTVEFLGGDGTGAAGTVVMSVEPAGTGSVVGVTLTAGVAAVAITSGGSGYTSPPTVAFTGGGGTDAAGTATVVAGAVTAVAITSGGSGYTSPPTVAFTGGGGTAAAATCTLHALGGVGYTEPPDVSFPLTVGGYDKEAEATCTRRATGGSGYTSAPAVSLTGGGGSGATAIAEVSGGIVRNLYLTTSVAEATLPSGGSAYQETTVLFSGGGGSGAAGTVTVVAEVVEAIQITAGGTGYTFAPDVTVSGGTGSGFTGTAILTGGVVTGVTVDDGGSSYPYLDVKFGTGATAYARIAAGAVASIYVQNSGGEYTTVPTVEIHSETGSGAVATAVLEGGSVTSITVAAGSGGSGYLPHNTDVYLTGGFASGTGSGAAARVVLNSQGGVSDIVMVHGGSGYVTAPTITITNVKGTGTGASAVAIGKLAGGSGYTSSPTLTFSGGGGTGATAKAKVSPYHLYGGYITLSGKSVGPYEEAYLLDFERHSQALVDAGAPALTYPVSVRVSRVTADKTAITVTDEITVVGYTEIQPYNLSYPDSALIALTLDAQKFGGSIPQRSFDVRGKKVRVPKGYNADGVPDGDADDLRTYPDFWDGTFEEKWSDNPAWILLDALTNTRYGAGIALDMVDVYALYQVSRYCDEVISHEVVDDHGTSLIVKEFRYTLNTVIASRREAHQVVQAIASTFRGMVYWSSGGVAFSQDRPKTASRLIAPADVVDGQFSYSSTARKARHSAALISWNNPEDSYSQDIEVFEDADLIDRYGYNPIEIVAYGTTSRSQARRLGRWIIDSETNETDTVTFRGGLDFSDMFPGEVFAVADPTKQGARLGGRLVSWSFQDVSPSAAVTSTTVKDGAIASIGGEFDAVFRCTVHVPSEIVSGAISEQCRPSGCVWEVGNATNGAYLGFDGDGDLVLRAGYGGSDLVGNTNDIARLVVANSRIPLDREIELLAEIRIGSLTTAGRVRLWVNSQFFGEAVTGNGSSLGSFDSDTGAKFGGSSGDIVTGEKAGYQQDVETSGVEIRSSLSYWSGGVAESLTYGETLSEEIASGTALTSVATYTGAVGSIHQDGNGSFECSITTPASGTVPRGVIFEIGDGSGVAGADSPTEGHYVGFDAGGNLLLHAGDGTPGTSTGSILMTVPASRFAAGTQYHLVWEVQPSVGTMSLWIDEEFHAKVGSSPVGTPLSNGRFADNDGGGYGTLGTNTVTGMVSTVFNGTLDTPLRYYEGVLISDNADALYHGTITLDQAYSVQANDRILFMTNEATVDSLALQAGTTGDTVRLLERPTRIPVDSGMYVIQAAAANAKEYRVLSVRELEDLKFEVVGLEYDKTKFDRIEKGLIVDRPVTSLFPTGAMLPPTDLTFRESLYRADGQVRTKIDLSCSPSPDPRVSLYQWDIRRPASEEDGTQSMDNWELLVTHSSPTATVFDAETGIWGFRVTAVAGSSSGATSPLVSLDQLSDATQASEVFGKTLRPADVQDLVVIRGFSRIRLRWSAVADLDLRDYVVVQGTAWPDDLSLPDAGVTVTYINATDTTIDVATTDPVTFMVRARDTSGLLSAVAASVEAQVATMSAVANLKVYRIYNPQSIYSGDAKLTWDALDIRDEVVSYEIRATDVLGGAWDVLERGLEVTNPQGQIKVPLESGTEETYEFKVRPFIELQSGSRIYGAESSSQLIMRPGGGTSHRIQNEHTAWSSLSSNIATSFLANGADADQSTASGTTIFPAWKTGWEASASAPEFDRAASGVWAVTINVPSGITPRGCVFEMGNTTKGCYLGFNASGDLIWRAGYGENASANVDLARVVVANSAIPTDADFTILCDIRNDGSASGRVRIWIDDTLMATGETSDGSAFTGMSWSGAAGGKVNGFYNSAITGETGSYLQAVTTSGVTFESELRYWRGVIVEPPLVVSQGELVLSEGFTYGRYIYEFDLLSSMSGELNYVIRATNIAAASLKVFEATGSVFSHTGIAITPTAEASVEEPDKSFSISIKSGGSYLDYVPLVTATEQTFQYSLIKLELRRTKTSLFRPSVNFLQTTLGTS